ncbi:hypothetical protein D9758_016039 [Tetrapyrgos nigripes]|uniref:Uncharacterized protein n=1 Tax=Tetrapyrgos nigripes TaxID=182062 RepID=A0A8H5FI81_9AGAR|nr:hypothetical protein D9758_016039 [Tetrapyrgos nigripes]
MAPPDQAPAKNIPSSFRASSSFQVSGDVDVVSSGNGNGQGNNPTASPSPPPPPSTSTSSSTRTFITLTTSRTTSSINSPTPIIVGNLSNDQSSNTSGQLSTLSSTGTTSTDTQSTSSQVDHVSPTPEASTITVTASPSTSADAVNVPSPKSPPPTQALIGGIAGAFVFTLMVGFVIWYHRRRSRRDQSKATSSNQYIKNFSAKFKRRRLGEDIDPFITTLEEQGEKEGGKQGLGEKYGFQLSPTRSGAAREGQWTRLEGERATREDERVDGRVGREARRTERDFDREARKREGRVPSSRSFGDVDVEAPPPAYTSQCWQG